MNMHTTVIASARTEPPPPDDSTRAALHAREHAACFACGIRPEPGLGLRFTTPAPGEDALADWCPPAWAISYQNTVHGGLVATVLDGAMVHALFAREHVARTAELSIRYRRSVLPLLSCVIRARLVRRRGSLFQLEATLHQAGLLCAQASSTFISTGRSGCLP